MKKNKLWLLLVTLGLILSLAACGPKATPVEEATPTPKPVEATPTPKPKLEATPTPIPPTPMPIAEATPTEAPPEEVFAGSSEP